MKPLLFAIPAAAVIAFIASACESGPDPWMLDVEVSRNVELPFQIYSVEDHGEFIDGFNFSMNPFNGSDTLEVVTLLSPDQIGEVLGHVSYIDDYGYVPRLDSIFPENGAIVIACHYRDDEDAMYGYEYSHIECSFTIEISLGYLQDPIYPPYGATYGHFFVFGIEEYPPSP